MVARPLTNALLIAECIGDGVLTLCLRVLFHQKYPETHYPAYRGLLNLYLTNEFLKGIAQREGIAPVGHSTTAYGKAMEVYLGELFLLSGLETAQTEVDRLIEKYVGWEKITEKVEAKYLSTQPKKPKSNDGGAPPSHPKPKATKVRSFKAPEPRAPEASPPEPLPIVRKPTSLVRRYPLKDITEEFLSRNLKQPTTLFSQTMGGYITASHLGSWRADSAAIYFLEDAMQIAKKLSVQDIEFYLPDPLKEISQK